MTSLRKERVSFNPVKTVQVRGKASGKFTLLIVEDSDLIFHFDFVVVGPCLDERPIKVISVECGENSGLGLFDVCIEFHE